MSLAFVQVLASTPGRRWLKDIDLCYLPPSQCPPSRYPLRGFSTKNPRHNALQHATAPPKVGLPLKHPLPFPLPCSIRKFVWLQCKILEWRGSNSGTCRGYGGSRGSRLGISPDCGSRLVRRTSRSRSGSR